ncbi:MAG: tyrosine-type recombinase/integrase [Candidatus Heimdallarchaeaceae archaeon]
MRRVNEHDRRLKKGITEEITECCVFVMRIMSLKQVSEKYGQNPHFWKRACQDNDIEHSKIKNRYYIEERRVREFLEYSSKCKPARRHETMSKNHEKWFYASGRVERRTTEKFKKEKWTIYYKDSHGNWRKKTVQNCSNKKQAELALSNQVEEEYKKKNGQKIIERMRFSEFAEKYIEKCARKKKSFKTERSCIKFLSKYFSNRYLEEVTTEAIDDYKEWRLKTGCRRITVNMDLKILSIMLHKAVRWNNLEKNELPIIEKYKKTAAEAKPKHVLSLEEQHRLLKNVPKDNDYLVDIILFALSTGCRRGDILKLKWLYVYEDEIRVPAELTKNGNEHNFKINDTVRKILKRRKAQQHNKVYVFTSSKTNKPFVNIDKAFKKAVNAAKIKNFSFHGLRRTFATRLAEANVPIVQIRDLLCHSSTEVTNRYLGRNKDREEDAVKILDSMFQKDVHFFLESASQQMGA